MVIAISTVRFNRLKEQCTVQTEQNTDLEFKMIHASSFGPLGTIRYDMGDSPGRVVFLDPNPAVWRMLPSFPVRHHYYIARLFHNRPAHSDVWFLPSSSRSPLLLVQACHNLFFHPFSSSGPHPPIAPSLLCSSCALTRRPFVRSRRLASGYLTLEGPRHDAKLFC